MNMTTLPPDAQLIIATGCSYCPRVLESLGQGVKEGWLGRLEVTNASVRPDLIHGVHTVPWTRIGEFELEGVLTPAEARRWSEAWGRDNGWAIYVDHLLTKGQRQRVEALMRTDPARLLALVQLLGDPEVGINTRLGIGAVLEELAPSGLTTTLIHPLGALTRHDDPRLRGDACHYLPLTSSAAAIPYLRERLEDDHPDVREIAAEALETLERVD